MPIAQSMGITTKLDPVASLVLGSEEVFPLDMASGYSTWAHRGEHITPTAILKVERPDGTVVTFDQPRAQVLTQQQSDLVTYCLQQVVHGGTGSGAYFGKEIAGKTGTTEDNTDAWFVGFTPNGYTTAVWMGYDNAPGAAPTVHEQRPRPRRVRRDVPRHDLAQVHAGDHRRDGRRQLRGPEVVPRQGAQLEPGDHHEHDGARRRPRAAPRRRRSRRRRLVRSVDDAPPTDLERRPPSRPPRVDARRRRTRARRRSTGARRVQSSGSAAPTGWWG